MPVVRLQQFVDTIELVGAYSWLSLQVQESRDFTIDPRFDPRGLRAVLCVRGAVLHRDTGEQTYVMEHHEWDERMRDKDVHRWILTKVQKMAVHELFECFRVNGRIAFDPHVGDAPVVYPGFPTRGGSPGG